MHPMRLSASAVLPGISAICFSLVLAGCGEVDTNYTSFRHMTARGNREASALVDSTAQVLGLKLDPEGLSPYWHSFDHGSLSIELDTASTLDGSWFVWFADDRLRRKRHFIDAKQNLTRGLRRIDPGIQIVTRWTTSAMM